MNEILQLNRSQPAHTMHTVATKVDYTAAEIKDVAVTE